MCVVFFILHDGSTPLLYSTSRWGGDKPCCYKMVKIMHVCAMWPAGGRDASSRIMLIWTNRNTVHEATYKALFYKLDLSSV